MGTTRRQLKSVADLIIGTRLQASTDQGVVLHGGVAHRHYLRRVANGDAEPLTLDIFSARLDGRAVLDVGAYLGIYALTAAIATREVWAFEPDPRNHRALTKNVEANSSHVRALQLAVSHRPGMVPLSLAAGGQSQTRIERPGELEVEAVALDDLVPPDADVGLVKVDVEGHEPSVLAGAVELISRCKPTLIIEAQRREAQLLRLIRDLGYSVQRVIDDRAGHMLELEEWDGATTVNLLCDPR